MAVRVIDRRLEIQVPALAELRLFLRIHLERAQLRTAGVVGNQ
jgi:hypothetical protein